MSMRELAGATAAQTRAHRREDEGVRVAEAGAPV